MRNSSWRTLYDAQKRDNRNGERFTAMYRASVSEGMGKDDIGAWVDGIYDPADYDDLLFLAYAFASYKTPLARQLLAYYGALRPDRFEGWDAPIEWRFDRSMRSVKRAKNGYPLPNPATGRDRMMEAGDPLVTIYLPAYNELEYVRLCVESLYKYTQGIHYDLLCKDNGSQDGVLEYFNRLPHKKAVARGERTGPDDMRCVNEPFPDLVQNQRGRYTVGLSADVILTPRWLHNLLICAQHNPSAAYICPTSNEPGVPAKQSMHIPPHATIWEMWEYAQKNNNSDPSRWERHVSLIDFIALSIPENRALYGNPDPAFVYNSMTDYDRCLRQRKADCLVICAKDCFCHHFGAVTMTQTGMVERRKRQTSLQILKEKHQGYDAADVERGNGAFVQYAVAQINNIKQHVRILSIDDRTGENTQQLRNQLISGGVSRIDCEALLFSEDDMQFALQTNDNVRIGGIETLCEWPPESFDYILFDGALNGVNTAQTLQMLMGLLMLGGKCIFRWRNVRNINNLRDKIVNPKNRYSEAPSHMMPEGGLRRILQRLHVTSVTRWEERLPNASIENRRTEIQRMEAVLMTTDIDCRQYVYCIEKTKRGTEDEG